MIQPLRAAHRIVFFFLIPILLAVFVGGLLARHKWPRQVNADLKQLSDGEQLISEKNESIGNLKFDVRLLRLSANPTTRAIQLIPKAPVVAPDVLIYWSAQTPQSALPVSAQLLGPYHPQAHYRLPTEAQETGSIILYSLGHQKILGSFLLEKQP